MRVLVTGGGGFVAPWLKNELESHGHEVFLSRRFEGEYACDLCDIESVKDLFTQVNPDTVVHLAGLSSPPIVQKQPQEAFRSNIVATTHIAEACTLLSSPVKLLFSSTGMVFKPTNREYFFGESEKPNPQNPYSHMKLACESTMEALIHYGHKVWIARPFNHTGVGQTPDFAIPAFIQKVYATENDGAVETGPLDSVRDFTDVRDIVRSYRLILEKEPAQKLFHLGRGEGLQMSELFAKVCEIAGKKVTPKPLMRVERNWMVCDSSQAKSILDWNLEFTIDQTLEEMWKAYLESQP